MNYRIITLTPGRRVAIIYYMLIVLVILQTQQYNSVTSRAPATQTLHFVCFIDIDKLTFT